MQELNDRPKNRGRPAPLADHVGDVPTQREDEGLDICHLKLTEESAISPCSAAFHISPPENIGPDMVYRLYRGITANIGRKLHHMWVDFTTIQLRWAACDVPSAPGDDISLLSLSATHSYTLTDDMHSPPEMYLEVYDDGLPACAATADASSGQLEAPGSRISSTAALIAVGHPQELAPFSEALKELLSSRDKEGKEALEFIQKRLFQYLWVRQGALRSEQELFDGQAVLAFNLDPRGGVAYLRSKLGLSADEQVGEWLARLCSNKGGIDPTVLGNYFSRRDTLEVAKTFIAGFDFAGLDIVDALRRLFDTFKPGGESQVITRVLEMFAETYFQQWQDKRAEVEPAVSYGHADSVLQVAVSLIMLNTGLHVLPTKVLASKRRSRRWFLAWQPPKPPPASMTVEQYISNTRNVVDENEVPETALRCWYETVRHNEIQVEPLPRMAFSTLPVQPDIEGWLILVLGRQVRRRAWAVLALHRLYLFSDRGSEVEPSEVLDLRDMSICSVPRDGPARERLKAELRGRSFCTSCRASSPEDLGDLIERSFQLWYGSRRSHGSTGKKQQASEGKIRSSKGSTNSSSAGGSSSTPTVIELSHGARRERLTLVAETPDLMEKWVSLIACGP